MPSFLHPALFWTLGLPTLGVVAVPVLIHLINMMRHRRVEWAAMEFLLVSQKKNRTWVMLKQLLLLLLRMAAVAAVVLVVAQPRVREQLGNLLGGTRTHHIVLLDDSFSMSDRWRDTDAFSEAKKVIQRIGAEAARQTNLQAFTLLRFSRVGRFQRATEADLLKEPVTAEFAGKLEELLGKLKVTQTSVGAAAGAAGHCPVARPDRRPTADRLSGFRLPRPRVERPGGPPRGIAETRRERRGDPPGQLRRSGAAQFGDCFAGAGRGNSRRRRPLVHGSGRGQLRLPNRPAR